MPAGFPRELLDRPTSDRLAYFRSYTIAHPRLKTVSDALGRAIQEPAGRTVQISAQRRLSGVSWCVHTSSCRIGSSPRSMTIE
jgi:hypothetical protein